MTDKQIEWASRHDWFRAGWGLAVEVYDYACSDTLVFTDFQALRRWAGY